MTYTKQEFVDYKTLLTAGHLIKMEDGIIAAQKSASTNTQDISAIKIDIGNTNDNLKKINNKVEAISIDIIDKVTSSFAEKGNIVTCHPVEGYPLEVKTCLEPVQSGSGEASPDNVRPIAGHTGAKLTRCGKNLFDSGLFPEADNNGITFKHNADGGIDVKGTSVNYANTYTDIAGMLPPGAYTVSNNAFEGGGSYVRQVFGNGSAIATMAGDSFTLTGSEEHVYVFLQVDPNTTHERTVYIQIEPGSVATTYEPYQGDAFSASFGQTVYGGTLDWGNGELTVYTAFREFTGSEPCLAFEMLGSYARCQFYVAGAPMGETFGKGLFSHGVFKADHYEDSAHAYVNELFWLFLPADSARDAGSAQAYLAAQYAAGTPVQIAYKLAEPFTIQLTPTQILALKGKNNLWSDTGETEVQGAIDPEYLNGTGGGNTNITINGTRPDENGNFIINTLNDVEIAQLQAVIT